MPTTATVQVTLTELPQFRRLVQFAEEVARHAEEENDSSLRDMTQQLLDDLVAMR